MRRIVLPLLSFALVAGAAFSGCGDEAEPPTGSTSGPTSSATTSTGSGGAGGATTSSTTSTTSSTTSTTSTSSTTSTTSTTTSSTSSTSSTTSSTSTGTGGAAPTCTDAVKNGNETDVDCGGPSCPKCADGMSCLADSDCTSGSCQGNLCVNPNIINGCDPATAKDMTGMASVSIAFGGANGFAYKPPCIKVTAGTQVTFNGDFSFHPLQGGKVVGGVEMPASAGTTPLPTNAGGLNTGTSATFTMQPAGTYGYYCFAHGSIGMDGAIFVQ